MTNPLIIVAIILLIILWALFLWGLFKKPPKKWWLIGGTVGLVAGLLPLFLNNVIALILSLIFPIYITTYVLGVGLGYTESRIFVVTLISIAVSISYTGAIAGLFSQRGWYFKLASVSLLIINLLIGLFLYTTLLAGSIG